MKKLYLGIDIGSVTIKGVLIDKNNNIIASSYLYTNGDSIAAIKMLMEDLKNKIILTKYKVVGVGITGALRRTISKMLGINVIKNEITAHAVGAMSVYSNVRTIFEIGGSDSKIIMIENGIVTNYTMNNIYASGLGKFISSQADKLGVSIEEFGNLALYSNNPIIFDIDYVNFYDFDSSVYLEMGYKIEDIVAGICYFIVKCFLNNINKDIDIKEPIVFQGGVSKNNVIVRFFEDIIKHKVLVSKYSHLMGAIGAAIVSKGENEIEFSFDFDVSMFAVEIGEG